MLSFSGSLKVFVAVEPSDMRKSFQGLHDAVAGKLNEDPKSGAIFAFTNKRRTPAQASLLRWKRFMGFGEAARARDLLVAEGHGYPRRQAPRSGLSRGLRQGTWRGRMISIEPATTVK